MRGLRASLAKTEDERRSEDGELRTEEGRGISSEDSIRVSQFRSRRLAISMKRKRSTGLPLKNLLMVDHEIPSSATNAF